MAGRAMGLSEMVLAGSSNRPKNSSSLRRILVDMGVFVYTVLSNLRAL